MKKLQSEFADGLSVRLRGVPLRTAAQSERLLIGEAGTLPENAAAALPLINAALPAGALPLTENDVYYHTVEGVNTQYIPSYFMFMDTTTIANTARNGAEGMAFMTRHNWGDLFSAGELPSGKTIAGKHEQVLTEGGQVLERAIIGFYMLRAHSPNGAQVANTDELHKGIMGGTIFDVSLTFRSDGYGETICNVCGMDYNECSHIRGYNDNMTLDEQLYARDVLGVPGGVATIRLVNWYANEVSAVYDGAVAGAGF